MFIERLTQLAFAPFGNVARSEQGTTKSIRDGSVLLTKSPASFSHSDEAVDLSLDFYDVQPEGKIIHLVQAERHEHSSQMFIPISVKRYLVVVWPDDPREGSEAEAFLGMPGDVVIYNPGIWHHGIIALDERGLFASTMWRTRGGRDVEFVALPTPVDIATGRLDQ